MRTFLDLGLSEPGASSSLGGSFLFVIADMHSSWFEEKAYHYEVKWWKWKNLVKASAATSSRYFRGIQLSFIDAFSQQEAFTASDPFHQENRVEYDLRHLLSFQSSCWASLMFSSATGHLVHVGPAWGQGPLAKENAGSFSQSTSSVFATFGRESKVCRKSGTYPHRGFEQPLGFLIC